MAIETTDAQVKVKLETKSGLTDYALAWRGIGDSAKIAEALSTDLKSESRPKLQVEFVAELVDKYNKISVEPILTMTWQRSELEKMTWQPSPTPWDVLRLVDDVRYFNRGGEMSMVAYCTEESQQKYAADFCRKFAK